MRLGSFLFCAKTCLKHWTNGKKVYFQPKIDPPIDLDAPVRKGIDMVYENTLFQGKPPPPKYLINEVKRNNTNKVRTPNKWKSGLGKTKVGKQMGDKWVERNVFETFDRKLARDIMKNHERFLTGVSKNGNSIDIFELTNNATKINTTKL